MKRGVEEKGGRKILGGRGKEEENQGKRGLESCREGRREGIR